MTNLSTAQSPCVNGSEVRIRLCEGNTFQFGSQTVSNEGTFTEIFTNQSGCDSTVQLSVTLIPIRYGDTLYIEQEGTTPYIFYDQPYSTSGIYSAQLTASTGCDSLVFLNLILTNPCATEITNQIELGNPTCATSQDGFLIFNPIGGQAPYEYSIDGGINFDTTALFDQLSIDDFSVIVKDNNGCLTDANPVNLSPTLIPMIDLGQDTMIEQGQAINLAIKAKNFEPTTYSWESEMPLPCLTCPNFSIPPSSSTNFTLIATDENGCIAKDTLSVTVQSAFAKVYIPNAFSPNGDGINDYLEVYGSDEFLQFNLAIFDRWGNQLFMTNNYSDKWDGFVNSESVATGVYFIHLQYQLLSQVDLKTVNTTVSIIR